MQTMALISVQHSDFAGVATAAAAAGSAVAAAFKLLWAARLSVQGI